VFPTVVVGTGNQSINLTVDGKQVTSHSRFTIVWRRAGESWKCIAYQSTPVPDLKEQQTFR
jgi:ketosteroid isomerase-like protein